MLKRLFCNHRYDIFRNIYGDEINHLDARCEISCSKCGSKILSDKLVLDTAVFNDVGVKK